MKKYTTATANQLEGVFGAFNKGFISKDELFENSLYLLNDCFDAFCEEQQKRVDLGLKSTITTLKMIEQIRDFCKLTVYNGKESFSFANWCSFLWSCERWLKAFQEYYPKYKGLMFECVDLEPVSLGVPTNVYVTTFKSPVGARMPQQDQQKKGKSIRTFRDLFICKPEEQEILLKKLHQIIEGEKGKNAALAVYVCVENGKILKPNYREVYDEFGDIGQESNFRKYLNTAPFSELEKEGIKKALFD